MPSIIGQFALIRFEMTRGLMVECGIVQKDEIRIDPTCSAAIARTYE